MNQRCLRLLLVHPEVRAGYALARAMHARTSHSVVAVAQEVAEAERLVPRLATGVSMLRPEVLVGFGVTLPAVELPTLALPLTAELGELVAALESRFPDAAMSDPARVEFYRGMVQGLLREAWGVERSDFLLLPQLDQFAVMDRIEALQGPSPWDRAWPTEDGHLPAPEPGWDAHGEFRPDVLRQVHSELNAAGKL